MKQYFPFIIGAALLGCSAGEGALPLAVASDSLPPLVERASAVLAAVPLDGGRIRFFDPASLDRVVDAYEPSVPALASVWGVDVSTGALLGLTDEREAVAIDLGTGRRLGFAESVITGSLSQNGTATAITEDGGVVTFRRRARREYAPFVGDALAVLARHDGRIILTTAGDSQPMLHLLDREGETRSEPIPGPTVIAPYGDRVLVIGDSSVTVYDPDGTDEPVVMPMRANVSGAAFSPSGHQIFVTTDAPALHVVQRYPTRSGTTYTTPIPVEDLRLDPLGQWLLLRQADADSVLVLQTAPIALRVRVASEWSQDFPMLTPDGVLLTRVAQRITAMEAGTFDTLGTMAVLDGVAWVATTLRPTREISAGAEPDTPEAADPVEGGAEYFVQIASSQNAVWAEDLANTLVRDANLPARVLAPEAFGDGYRVVVGPFPTREAADEVGTSLSRPFWIYVREPSDSLP